MSVAGRFPYPSRAGLYFHTLRHLRPVQIYGRIWRELGRSAIDTAPAPPRAIPGAALALPARRRSAWVAPFVFRFLNEEHAIRGPRDWDNPGQAKLWRYHLHYFDGLNAWNTAESRAGQRGWLHRWIAENPPGQGSGWEPYPISLRVVNWIKWALRGNELPADALESLAVQVRYLRRKLEIHLLGNHLFANAKALACAGMFFQGPEAEGWLAKGLDILDRELGEQILPDGGHFERSPMYHALALEDLLDLVNLGRCLGEGRGARLSSSLARWSASIGPMRAWLAAMSHPDGRIGFFNDAAHGLAPDNGELERYALDLGFPPLPAQPDGVRHFPDSGYIRVQRGDLVALLDVAPIGPDYLPGHAHADTLCFECSWWGERVLVNRGTSRYGLGPERLAERGTAAHNTVAVDGKDSSEVWGGFRVARRARPFGLSVDVDADAWVIECAHDGYKRLPDRPVHRRTWRFGPDSLRVEDRVAGRDSTPHPPLSGGLWGGFLPRGLSLPPRTRGGPGRGFRAIARFHCHPHSPPHPVADGWLAAPGVAIRVETGAVRLEDGYYAPEFGLALPNQTLAVELDRGRATTIFRFR